MVDFYVTKIQSGVINDKTGQPWNIEDIPKLWKKKVETALAKAETK